MLTSTAFLRPALAIGFFAIFTIAASAAIPLPWERETPLREGAKSVFITLPLNPVNPQPNFDSFPRGPALQVSNLSIRSTLWGPSDRITVSVLKNDIWDRRVAPIKFTSPTLDEIVRGANAPVNKNASDILPNADSTRPRSWGYLRPEGGRASPFQDGTRYPFPTAKPTGQIILGFDALKGAPQPELAQSCADGAVRFRVVREKSSLALEYVLSMTRNLYAIRGTWSGDPTKGLLRLYRHRDTGHLGYMNADGSAYKEGPRKEVYESENAWNGPIEAPESGTDGEFFWIRQTLPAEKTFPKGFHYVMMGTLVADQAPALTSLEKQTGLGTPVPDKAITAAPGAAATAEFSLKNGAKFRAYVVIVTEIDTDGTDIMAEARRRLEKAAADGFDGIAAENARWYGALYDKREDGRIFTGNSGTGVTDDIKNIFNSWYCTHDGGTRTDMRKYQASAHYVVPEKDSGMYGSLPCYNEVFYTPEAVRNRSDSTLMWKQIVAHWFDAAKANARETYGMPGMFITHGFLPPIKADRYVHSNIALELAVETMAQVYKTFWDEWDYGADPKVLEEIYPAMREMAIFYAAYAKKGDDGFYHIIPAAQEESYSIQPVFSHNKDTISAIAMFRWALTRAAEAAVLLDRDAELRKRWIEVAANLTPYPTWQKPEGLIFAGMPGVEPWRGKGEHPWDIGMYPTVLADDINLDSDSRDKETMLLTVKLLRAGLSDRAEVLLGKNPPDKKLPANADFDVAPYVEHPERLLNSRSGRIHLFPTLPPAPGPVAFRHFQARGGFLVSACYDGKIVTYLEIEARRDLPCLLMNPWPGRRVAIRSVKDGSDISYQTDNKNGECLIFAAKSGQSYRVMPIL